MPTPHIPQKSPFVLTTNAGTYWWCACGKSLQQPFCDGAHTGSGFAPVKMDLAESKTVAWCGCKHSKNGAFCDGSHGTLA
jgi:CDGSH iron-sulfur domain-containing protein 3